MVSKGQFFFFDRFFISVFRFWMIFFFGFAVSNRPQCPAPLLNINHEQCL